MKKTFRILCAALMLLFVGAGSAKGALVLAINTYTTDELSFTISGTFDADTISNGGAPGYLSLKHNYSNKVATHVNWMLPLVDDSDTTVNTIMIDGAVPGLSLAANSLSGSDGSLDAVYFTNPLGPTFPITAGTSVSGSFTISQVSGFSPTAYPAGLFELASGFSQFPFRWTRFEASAIEVPEPSTYAMLAFAALAGFLCYRRKQKLALQS